MIKKNETIESCALRQAKREAGLNISRDELIFGGIQEEIHPNSVFENVSYHAINIFYGYILDDIEQIKLDEQHEEYKWFSVNNETLHPFITAKIKKLLEI
jgi:ADP-ribose pyrophosphatase YjhB (NUDIX family)